LRFHWGEAYKFGYKDGHYIATSRNSDHATLTARDADELLAQVRRHYRPPLQERSST
jgi:hypothetical protein